jgi:signal transduction histidine kinase/DNA-binding response OmpR family regulator
MPEVKPGRVLLVDDNPANLEAYAAILEPLGAELLRANSGERALSLVLREEDLAVILLDVQMPGMDGYDTARLIRNRERSRHFPIIFLTASDREPRIVQRGYSVGAVDFLEKPIDAEALRSKVTVFLELSRRAAIIREQAEQLRIAGERKLKDYQRWSEQRYATLADAVPELVWTADADGSLVFRNRRWLEHTGGRAAPPGFEDLIEAEDLTGFLASFSAARSEGQAFESELRFKGPSEPRWHLMRVVPTRSSDGSISGWVGTGTDIDSQKRDQRLLAMLASFTRVLGELTEGAAELERALGCALPVLGDALLLDWRPEDGPPRRVAAAAPGSRVPPLDDARLDLAPSTVVYTGRPEVHLDLDAPAASTRVAESDQIRFLRELGIRAYLCLPLASRGRLLGSLTLFTAGSGRAFSPAEVSIAEDVGRRLATALDNLRLYEVAERERRRLTEASHSKDVFLATLSHELRTPLNAIVGFSHLLKSGALGSEQSLKAVDTIERNARSLAQLVADLLDVSRIISGNLKVDMKPVGLRALIEAQIHALRPTAQAAGVELEIDMADVSARVLGDGGRLQQVLGNVLTNAVKFTPQGGMIRVRLEQTPEETARLVVSDTGQGMTPEFLAVAFEPFRQAQRTHARSQEGLGLGLAIVKHLIDLHGGSVHAESPGAGQGSTITIELPLAPTSHARHSVPSTPPGAITPPAGVAESELATPLLRGVRALVVEDDPDGCELLETVLRGFGATVTTANSARNAFEMMENERPDVVVSDIGLPDEDGLSLIRRVRQTAGLRDLPAVALTAYASKRDVAQALAAGFHAHVAKPVEPRALGLAIARVSGR